ncbi:MAG TPA: RNA 2',3'-cyclic phosphodiesterase [Calditrichia bacterium]|nr:RNA 2',3'-cyclic phosphodiesterase [Calditrichota bacterium]HQU74620.1 RNA 2',3'-cyclic phosphodiesterase [Calditrichia bacterium]HQV30618.1 RNA 2',3'-cyclic phosphodiesterase [Calditrichia bacterium]
MKPLRTFIAIDIGGDLSAALPDLLSPCRALPVRATWVSRENLHITLKFLGDVLPERIPAVSQVLFDCAESTVAFSLQTTGWGAFPNWRSPRVLWLGLDVPSGHPLRDLNKQVEVRLMRLGFARENRPFRPHITLGYVKSPRNTQLLMDYFQDLPSPSVRFEVGEFRLVKSELTAGGPIYETLDHFPFSRG